MGKKTTMKEEDPILSHNFKYDKRKKERDQEREQLQREK